MTHLLIKWANRAKICLGGAMLCTHTFFAQPTEVKVEDPTITPLDDITSRKVIAEHSALPYQNIREADIAWERRIWRVIDVHEKMNLSFISPDNSLFELMTNAIKNGDLTVYSAENDKFTEALLPEEIDATLHKTDTITTFRVEDYTEEVKIVKTDINPENITRFRLKEVWYFDKNIGQMKVRILGIAPMYSVKDDDGNFKYELPLFWVHYPSARQVFANKKVYLPGDNMASTMSWEDMFEMRFFSSTIYKENNIQDRRLFDYLAGTDLLLEADRIKNEIFNYEQDMWQK